MSEKVTSLFDLDKPGVQVTVDSMLPGKGMVWGTLFPLKYTPRFDVKVIEGEDGLPISGDRVAFNTKAKVKTRKKIGSINIELGKYSKSMEKDEKEIEEYEILKQVANANTEDKEAAKFLVEQQYGDVEICAVGLDARIELDALRIGSTGKQEFKEELDGDIATMDVIDFNIPNKIGSPTKFSDPKTDGIGEIVKAQKLIRGLAKPKYAFMEQSKFDQILLQDMTAKRVASAAQNALNLTTAEALSLEMVNRYMSSKGYPTIITFDSYCMVEDNAGKQTEVKPWNENVIVLSPVPRLGYTYYKVPGIDRNSAAMQVQSSYRKVTVYNTSNPRTEVTLAETYAQIALSNRKSLVMMNTENTTWAGGAKK